ncbi:DUF3626 domain-containing protein [Brevibacillus centrosporus]|uniref:DUF3626 domain-containing protein n=1 Tax=Brevibacillus centrosporus TaxID=54910 RepID=UPI00399CF861
MYVDPFAHQSHQLRPQTTLTAAQSFAIQFVQNQSTLLQQQMREQATSILQNAGVDFVTVEDLLTNIRQHARVTLNFHPDRVLPAGISVVEGLLATGSYHSQFETGVTNGGRTAYPGGDRDRWEEKLFGGAYQSSTVQEKERPKYGALNLMNYADGASPRFGSCFIQLRPHLLQRCTFTFGDSHTGPEHFGTADSFDAILAALLHSVETTKEALGSPNMDVPAVVQQLLTLRANGFQEVNHRIGRALDDYIEAQIHGDIDLGTDVEAIFADPSYQGTHIDSKLQQLAEKCGIELVWHPGFVLSVSDVSADFRGPAMPPLAARLDQRYGASSGLLDAATIGRASTDFSDHPDDWKDWGEPNETWQHLKQIWHVLVRYGRQAR